MCLDFDAPLQFTRLFPLRVAGFGYLYRLRGRIRLERVIAALLFHARPKFTPAVLGLAEKGKVPYDLELPRVNLLARQFGSGPFAEEHPHRWGIS